MRVSRIGMPVSSDFEGGERFQIAAQQRGEPVEKSAALASG